MSLFGPHKRRRRRRRHGSALRRTPEQLQLHQGRRRIRSTELLACTAVAVIAATLIALIWINTERAIHEQADDTRGRAEAAITAEAATLSAQVQRELQMIDQSLSVLQAAWNANPDSFDLANWRKVMPALTDVADDLFVANDKHLIVQDIVPAAVGQGIGSAYATFANGSLERIQNGGPRSRDNSMVVGELGPAGVVRQYLMYLIRPLDRPAGWMVGASYRSDALTRVFATAGLGHGGLAALVDTHRGGVQALAGTAALRPKLDLGNSPMYRAMQERPDDGLWIGRTSIDGVARLHAFHHVPGRDLIVLVGVASDEAMAPADNWAMGARSVATTASLLVVAISVTVLWELWNWRRTRRRQRAREQMESLVLAMQSDLATTRVRANAGTAQVQALLNGVSDGVAVVDAEQAIAAWNMRFAALSDLPPNLLRPGLALDAWLRQLAAAGRFGAIEDVEAEILRLAAMLRPETGMASVPISAPAGGRLVLQSHPTPDGGLVLILQSADVVPMVAPEEAIAADPVEW